MPMFNPPFEPIESSQFFSNPPVQDRPKVLPFEKDGKIVNKVVLEPGDNKPLYGGVHYSAETMSLRAKLNLGIPLNRVSLGAIENDPNIVGRNAVAFEQKVYNQLKDFSDQGAVDEQPSSN